jgi:hypothetical protein
MNHYKRRPDSETCSKPQEHQPTQLFTYWVTNVEADTKSEANFRVRLHRAPAPHVATCKTKLVYAAHTPPGANIVRAISGDCLSTADKLWLQTP